MNPNNPSPEQRTQRETVLSSPQEAESASDDVVIRAEALSKCYLIYDRPQDRLKQSIFPRLNRVANVLGMGRPHPIFYREFWALKDVSFEAKRGEALGVIGRNGAGKSTLLQLLAGTVTPTSGAIQVNGRVAALLELGSGFNPEFTGRENVFLNASLLGLTLEQTQERFDGIAAFADIGDFIEQPVKSYSSGMMMRLAFSVQTAIDPDIFIVDEALAVGDIFFQAKCMSRLRKLIDDGATLVLVSHDTGTVRQVCNRAIHLGGGKMIEYGTASHVTDGYMRTILEESARTQGDSSKQFTKETEVESARDLTSTGANVQVHLNLCCDDIAQVPSNLLEGVEMFRERAAFNRIGNGSAEIINVQLIKDGEIRDVYDFDDTVTLRQVVFFREALTNLNVAYKILTPQGVDVVFGDTRLEQHIDRRYAAGVTYVFEWTFPLRLMHGPYCIASALGHPPGPGNDEWIFADWIPICYDFRVSPRREGMIGAFVAWKNELEIVPLPVSAEKRTATT